MSMIPGWQLVPAQPTPEMIAAGRQARQDGYSEVAIFDAMLAAAPPPPRDAGREWLPIETAPKDGTKILLGRSPDLDEDGEPRTGVVAEGYWMDGYPDGPDCMGHDDCWTDNDFTVFTFPRSFGAESYRTAGYQPTHWMPLPAPPRALAGGGS